MPPLWRAPPWPAHSRIFAASARGPRITSPCASSATPTPSPTRTSASARPSRWRRNARSSRAPRRCGPARLAAEARNAGPAPRDADVGAEQHELDGMAGELTKVYHALPRIRFAFIPAEGQTYTIVTAMFLHTGFMHLLGNMLFFFVTGPFIEDVFGRPMFFFLYFSGGGVATAWYASKHPDSTIPLIGASGAIAAVMGAYFVRFVRSKLEFLFMPFPLFRPTLHFRFFMPAFVVLPLWFVQQFFLSNTAEQSGAGVAFSAHVGGFVYGFAVALVLKAVGFEEKFVVPVVEKQTTWKQDER